jgi:L-histidine N-alpha-methyltransferase
MLQDVWSGLNREQKEISSKYFYDERGSELFDRITELPEYYPTRAERQILERIAPEVIEETRPNTLVELGPGNGDKARILLDQLVPRAAMPVYAPVDVSESYLEQLSAELSAAYPRLTVRVCLSDITTALQLPGRLPAPLLIAFLGSTIGNFEEAAASALLAHTASVLQVGDHFLIGFDLKKDPQRLHAAYNDAAGVTAEFNLNILRALNAELETNFEVSAFEHRAFYNESLGRVEMHLLSLRPQSVRIDDLGTVTIREGETIRTEISCKYNRADIDALLGNAGLEAVRFDTDQEQLFAVVTTRRR